MKPPVSMPMSKWWAIRIRLCLVSALLAPAIHVLSSTLAPLAGAGILGSNYEWHGSFVVVHAFVLDTNLHTPRRIRAPSSRAIDDGADFFHREWTTPSIPAWRRIPTLSQSDFASRKIARRAKRKDVEPEPDPQAQADAVSRSELGQKFADLVEEALREETFVSLVLRGPKKPKKKKKGNSQDNSNSEDLRGSIRQVLGRLIRISSPKHKRGRRRSKKPSSGGGGNDDDDDDSTTRVVMQLTVKYHGATDICKNFPLSEVPKTIYDLVVGDPAEMASEWGVEAVRAQSIRSAQMVAVDKVCDLISPGETGTIGTIRTQAVQNTDSSDAASSSASSSASAIATSHDRVKQVPLSNRAEFFQRLGVTRDDGQPKPRMKGKLRQCQKFVEIVGRIVDDCQKQEQKSISVVDMGCGRAYLTFSLHSYLHDRYGSVTTTGIDVRPKLVAEISGIARSLGESFDSLNFEEGTIEQVVAESSALGSSKEKDNDDDDDDDSLSVLVALHACDTATDDALYSGIAQNANVIVVAPCCHKQVRPQLNAHFSSTRQTHALSSILKHGVYRERMSETVTDSLRALLLEFAGYKVQVFEFIGGEHTSKNVMITAIKSNQKLAKSDTESIRQQIMALAGLHGISRQKLARWMDFDLGGDHADQDRPSGKRKANQVSKLRMPPARL